MERDAYGSIGSSIVGIRVRCRDKTEKSGKEGRKTNFSGEGKWVLFRLAICGFSSPNSGRDFPSSNLLGVHGGLELHPVSYTQGKPKPRRTQFIQGHSASEAPKLTPTPTLSAELGLGVEDLAAYSGTPCFSADADSTFQSWPLEFLDSTKFLSPSAPFLLLQCFPYSLRVALQSFQTPRSPNHHPEASCTVP